MNRTAVSDLLRLPAAAFPEFTASPDVIMLWEAVLAPFDAEIALTVMRTWVETHDKAPTPTAILAEVRRLTADAAATRNVNRAEEPVDRAKVQGTIELLREVQQAAKAGTPMDPADVVRIARSRGLSSDGPPRRCVCEGGMVEVGADHPPRYRPCERCNAPAYERWLAGVYLPQQGGRR